MERVSWDATLQELDGHLMQSWQWGEYKRCQGWQVERVRVDGPHGSGMAQVLFKTRGPVSLAYIPRGPVLSGEEPAVLRELVAALDGTCRRRRAISLLVEPNKVLHLAGAGLSDRFVPNGRHFQPSRTVKVPLLADEALLQQMRPKTRYNIRLAQRNGFTVQQAVDKTALSTFHGLLQDTSRRNDFRIHPLSYYDDLIRTLVNDAALLFVHRDGEVAAGALAVRFGQEAIYLHGASSTEHRATGATAYLHYETMRWARKVGCERYDLGGLPAEDPPEEGGDRNPTTRGHDLRGMYKFKVGFGGEIVTYPPMVERRYWPLLARAAGRLMDRMYSYD